MDEGANITNARKAIKRAGNGWSWIDDCRWDKEGLGGVYLEKAWDPLRGPCLQWATGNPQCKHGRFVLRLHAYFLGWFLRPFLSARLFSTSSSVRFRKKQSIRFCIFSASKLDSRQFPCGCGASVQGLERDASRSLSNLTASFLASNDAGRAQVVALRRVCARCGGRTLSASNSSTKMTETAAAAFHSARRGRTRRFCPLSYRGVCFPRRDPRRSAPSARGLPARPLYIWASEICPIHSLAFRLAYVKGFCGSI